MGGLATAAIAAAVPGVAPAGAQVVLTPEMFGAKGDGRTNDTAAFGRLSRAIAEQGGGVVVLRRTTYIVGEQRPAVGDENFGFVPAPILSFVDLRGGVTIQGNGATLRCAPGLRYGSFDPRTGEPHRHAMPFLDPRTKATPYAYMVRVERCGGAVKIADLELDGDLPSMRLGTHYGDSGIQIEGTGLFLRDNRGDEIVRNVLSRRHPQDGMMIDGLADAGLAARVTRLAERVRCEDNGRQGCSLIGGRNWRFAGCAFDRTGRVGLGSAPAAGFDIEAEGGKINRGHRFTDCRFVDNQGCGLVADSGDSADIAFTRCRFVGTTNWSIWPNKPGMRFADCVVVGSAVHAFEDADPRRAAQFRRCLFTDDPKLSPTGRVWREGRADGSLFDMSDGTNVLFENCRMLAVAGAVLPWSTRAIYRDCVMRQGMNSLGYPRGIYQGRTSIIGRVTLDNSRFQGALTLNGKPHGQ